MVKIYTTSWCAPCRAAKSLLTDKNIKFEEIDIEKNNISREDLSKITGGHTVPQIVINDHCIGGFSDLMTLNQSNILKKILSDEDL